MTGGREGPCVIEVATSFPAHLLGAIGELEKKFLKLQMKEEEEEESQSALKIQREVVPSLSA